MAKRGAVKPSKFNASATLDAPVTQQIKINGAGYTAVDTGDGHTTVKDVPIFSEIPKGTHGAPYDVTKDELEKFLSVGQSRYATGRTGALSIGHNDDLGLTHPDFAGYFLPTKVARYAFPSGEKWALFADLKLPNAVFARFAEGKLPVHSPEIYPRSWDERRIDIVSFLDTKPSYFDWQNNTVSKITKDASAKFAAVWMPSKPVMTDDLAYGDLKALLGDALPAIASRFAAYVEATEKVERKVEKKDDEPAAKPEAKADEKSEAKGDEKGEKKADDEAKQADPFESDYPETHKALGAMQSTLSKMAESLGMNKSDPLDKKSGQPPIEPNEPNRGGKMSMDPETAAKFAAQANEVAEIRKQLAAQENEKRISSFMAKADSLLARKVLADRDIVAKFASDASAMGAEGDKWFTTMIEKLAPSLRDKPPSSVAEFASRSLPSVEPTDAALSKFAAQGPAVLEQAAKFAAQYRQSKILFGDHMTVSEEFYINDQIRREAAKEKR